jgi:hypothetical protein
MWTAACALVYELPVVTGDLGDFGKIAATFPALLLIHPDL